MPGSATYTPGSIPLARPSASILVFRFDSTQTGSDKYTLLPNVRCLGITEHEGSAPYSARFRYSFADPFAAITDPTRFEQVFPLDAIGPGVVKVDDCLVVFAFRADGYYEMLFAGFVQVPQVDLGPETETVSFVAFDLGIRESDEPLDGATYRDATTPLDGDKKTGLPVQFNPDGKPNASPEGGDSGEDPAKYPVFLGPFWPSNEINGDTVRPWLLGMAARYVIVEGSTNYNGDVSPYVIYDDLTYLDTLLQAIRPKDTSDTDDDVDEGDDSTFEFEPIVVQDITVTGMGWLDALWRLIEPHGFGMRRVITEGDPEDGAIFGDPSYRLGIWRKDDGLNLKQLNLQSYGPDLDPGLTNVGQLSLARDIAGIANWITVDSRPTLFEAGFVLVPGFMIASGDATSLSSFISGGQGLVGDALDKYRKFIFDECGEGHWDMVEYEWVTSPPGDFDPVLNTEMEKERPYVQRRRPGISPVIATNEDGDHLRASLFVSTDYAGPQPGVWDGTGTWRQVVSGSWRMLDDQLGIYITEQDPNSFHIGKDPSANVAAFAGSDKINLVQNFADPDAAGQPNPPIFMLNCCISDDFGLVAAAPLRLSTPTKFSIQRRIDATDRFRKQVICWQSWNADPFDFSSETNDIVVDDTEDAQGLADAQRRANEAGVFGGPVTIPRLSTAYGIGDKITGITGRNVSLRTNIGAGQGEAPTYPSVIGRTFGFEDAQSTILELSDRREEPPPRRRKAPKK